jgi:hypothetical protein
MEERDQFDEASNQIVVHLKAKVLILFVMLLEFCTFTLSPSHLSIQTVNMHIFQLASLLLKSCFFGVGGSKRVSTGQLQK